MQGPLLVRQGMLPRFESATLTAEVRTSDLMDRLVITPRDRGAVNTLNRVLRVALAGVRVHRSADGLWLAARDAPSLLLLENAAGLRWSIEARLFAENRRRARLAHASIRE